MAVPVRALLVICVAIAGLLWGEGDAVPSCTTVQTQLLPCLGYVTGKADAPSTSCCNGVKELNNEAATRADRQAICKCVQQAASNFPGIKQNLIAGLPQKCGVKTRVPITPNLDCSKIQ
ncbi:hypothetical protein H6P81_014301 [Aristolochia fimbriata]|uniref:Non-specific lipid-transfer protein n=1 Tax=Aristolochia fimbriata TaxID=158543 RepID=A0AAV7ELQ2_ARIFI|nr:hypothetical protein H6P81_014301 [Aristolochia fimbriata]